MEKNCEVLVRYNWDKSEWRIVGSHIPDLDGNWYWVESDDPLTSGPNPFAAFSAPIVQSLD